MVFYKLKFIISFPSNTSLFQWDVFFYKSIKEYGYFLNDGQQSNTAFFPLFPYIWRWVSLGEVGVATFNLCVFYLAYILLSKYFRFSPKVKIIYLSFPSMIFMFLPYSEALFFLFCTLILIGLSLNNLKLLILGLIGASLTRSVSFVFFPAIIIAEFLYSGFQKGWALNIIKKISLTSVLLLVGTSTVTYLQWYQTREWFSYIKVQKYWGRHFELPSFPLISYNPLDTFGLEASAVFIGLLALIFLALRLIRKLFYRKKNQVSKAFSFSAAYLAITVILGLFFSVRLDGRTVLFSLNRHIFCTPFFMIFILYFFKGYFNLPLVKKLSLLTLSFFIIVGAYHYLNGVYFICLFLLIIFYKRYNLEYLAWFFALINVVYQVILFGNFIEGRWVA